ncbi:MAG: hypothetical protein ABFC94_15920 [Syntrophomonas sp.]
MKKIVIYYGAKSGFKKQLPRKIKTLAEKIEVIFPTHLFCNYKYMVKSEVGRIIKTIIIGGLHFRRV